LESRHALYFRGDAALRNEESMISAELLISSITCINRIGFIDTLRAIFARSRNLIVKKLVGTEIAFRLARFDFRKVQLRTGTTDWLIFNQIFVRCEYDLEKFSQWSSISRCYEMAVANGGTPTIIDCGANVGLSAIWFALLFPKARVIAIEMEYNNFKQLKKNASAFPTITAINAAVWGEITKLTMKTANIEAYAYSAAPAAPGYEGITSVTIDTIVSEYKIESLLCVKLDVEGAEVSILDHAANWMDKVKVLIVELHDWKNPGLGSGKSLMGALQGRNFDLLVSGDLLVAIINSA
jgi:FkbM family methyltransferase